MNQQEQREQQFLMDAELILQGEGSPRMYALLARELRRFAEHIARQTCIIQNDRAGQGHILAIVDAIPPMRG